MLQGDDKARSQTLSATQRVTVLQNFNIGIRGGMVGMEAARVLRSQACTRSCQLGHQPTPKQET